MNFSDTALLLAAHGSKFDKEASAGARALAGKLRARKLFAEVHVAFGREAPFWCDALAVIQSPTVLVVPHFVSRGWFTETVLPRELALSGSGKAVRFCEPVGAHPLMVEALLRAARKASPSAAPERTSLLVIGHGTSRNKNSTAVVREQAERIARRGIYAECRALFMEEAPLVKDWASLTVMPDVVAVPFFISAGRHWQVDLPLMMKPVPPGKKLWYAKPIGEDERLVEIVLALAEENRNATTPRPLRVHPSSEEGN